MNKLELSYQKYHTSGNLRYGSYKGKFLLYMKEFVSFGTDSKSIYFMSNIFLKYKIDGVHVTLFQLACICNTTHPSHNVFVELCHEVHYMWWGNQELELQEWDYCIK